MVHFTFHSCFFLDPALAFRGNFMRNLSSNKFHLLQDTAHHHGCRSLQERDMANQAVTFLAQSHHWISNQKKVLVLTTTPMGFWGAQTETLHKQWNSLMLHQVIGRSLQAQMRLLSLLRAEIPLVLWITPRHATQIHYPQSSITCILHSHPRRTLFAVEHFQVAGHRLSSSQTWRKAAMY